MTPQQFTEFAAPLAAAAQAKYGVNAIGMMAQCALETGWGEHAPGNMYFGIKATASWTGLRQTIRTTEYVNGEKVYVDAEFRAYATPEESFVDYAKLISSLSRYSSAMQYSGYNQVDQYLYHIAQGGYATSPSYYSTTSSIANTIKKFISEAQMNELIAKKKA